MTGIGRLVSEASAGEYRTQGRAVLLHYCVLRRGGMGLKKLTVIKIIGILHISCGVVLGNIKSLEALIIVYYLVIVLYSEAHACEYLLYLTGSESNGVVRTELSLCKQGGIVLLCAPYLCLDSCLLNGLVSSLNAVLDNRLKSVYKLSRFGRSLIDTMNSLQILNDNNVALRTADGSINTGETMGRLITTILAAVAEMELDNIHEQTFLGRQQKAREGKWNGGFSPYGYRISDGVTNEPDILVIEEEEAKIVRLIYDYYTKDKLGVAGIVTECDRLGIRKIPRKNSTLTRMNRKFVSDVLSNPVYCGKIAYGRRHLEKPDKTGKRKMVKPQDYILVDGRHEAIVSYEQFQEAQRLREARAPMCVKRADNEHAHLLATLIKCPVCGARLYGNTTRKKDKNGVPYKDYHFYACKHRLKINGQTCSFRTNINERDIDEPVVAIISKLINDPHLAELLSSKLDNSTDKKTVEEAIQAQKKLLDTVNANIARLTNQLDHLDYSSPIAERKAADMENRLNNLYNEVVQHEQYLDELYQRLYAINQNLLTKDAVLNILKQFSKLYEVMTPADRQVLIRTIVDEIQIYPEKQADGRIIKSIKLAIPIVYENGETPKISWDKETTVESIVCLVKHN